MRDCNPKTDFFVMLETLDQISAPTGNLGGGFEGNCIAFCQDRDLVVVR